MEKLLPLLSDRFVSVLESILKNNESQIATELLKVNDLINGYNKIVELASWYPEPVKTLYAIKKEIDSLITDEVRALSVRRDTFEISFTPKGKELVYTENSNWDRSCRQVGKPGRIIKKLMVFDYKEKDIEIFNNLLKSNLMCLGEFSIVSGEDITYWYNRDHYYDEKGTLGNSCMRYFSCQDYFGVYEDHANMLICTRNNLLLGRALVWGIDGKFYLDRIYTTEDYLVDNFIEYAKNNKWYIREDNRLLDSGDNQYWLGPEDNYTSADSPMLKISLKQHYDRFPYMDSFRYLDTDANCICTRYIDDCVELDRTVGIIQENYTYVCDCCGDMYVSHDENEIPDELIYSEYDEQYLCSYCRQYCSGFDEYINKKHDLVNVHSSGGVVNYPLSYIEEKSIVEDAYDALDRGWYIEVNGIWYVAESALFEVKDNRLVLK